MARALDAKAAAEREALALERRNQVLPNKRTTTTATTARAATPLEQFAVRAVLARKLSNN